MIKIKVVCVGNLKEQYLISAQNEYTKRLGKFCKIEIIECPESKLQDKSQKLIDKALEQEAMLIQKHLEGKIVVLDILGKQYDSEAWASKMQDIANVTSSITFVIGSSYGLSKTIKEQADISLSFSKFTFPHQLMRIILLEQIYRSMCINNNVTYHK